MTRSPRSSALGSILGISVASVVLLAWTGREAAAQTIQGNILGTIQDASGAVAPGVTVTVTSLEKGFKRTALSNDTGYYDAAHLEPGTYRVEAELPGFKSFVREGVVVEVNRKVRIDITLVVGAVTEKVVVTADTPVIESETGRIATFLDNRTVQLAVNNGRGLYNYLYMAPGASWGGSGYTVNGSRITASNYTFDGAQMGNPIDGRQYSALTPDIEYIKEVRVDAVGNSAEFARAGNVSQTSLSGTNQLHGSFTWTQRNGALDARNFFATARPKGIPQNTLFLSAGGPVFVPGVYDGRDKTFFFFHASGTRSASQTFNVFNVPTAAMRGGDFSALGTAVRDPSTGLPFDGNKIPANRLNAAASKFLQRFYPVPTVSSALPAANFTAAPIGSFERYDWGMRIDQKLTHTNTMYFRYWQRRLTQLGPDGPLGAGAQFWPIDVLGYRNGPNDALTSALVSDTHTFSPRVINELRLGFNRNNAPRFPGLKGKEIVDLVGLTGFPYPLAANELGAPAVDIAGISGIAVTQTTLDLQNRWNLVDHVSFVRGSHSFKTGVDIGKALDSRHPASPSAQFGTSTFDGFASGYPIADFLLGIPRFASRSRAISPYYGTNTDWALFFQDEWRVRPRFTLTWGLRYERYNPWVEETDRIHSFDPKTGSVVVPDEATVARIHPAFPKTIPVITAARAGFPSRSLVNTDTNNFAPRLGFAWRSGLADIVVRGGYGLFYNFSSRQGFRNSTGGPFAATETFDNAITAGAPLWQWPQAFPATGARDLGLQDIFATAADMIDSYVHQYNLTLEKQFGNYGVRASYINTTGIHIPLRRNINQPPRSTTAFAQSRRPYPLVRNVTYFDRGATQSYNAFQFEIRKRFSKGFSTDVTYTWAKNLTDAQDDSIFGQLIEDAYDRRRERGNERYTMRHDFRWFLNWEIPVGSGRAYLGKAHPIVNGFVGGWTVTFNTNAGTGPWMSVWYQGLDTTGTNVTQGRADRICDGKLGNPTPDRWYDTSCFVRPPAGSGRFGNGGRAAVNAPGWWGSGLGLFKTFRLPGYEGLNLRFDARMSNVFNHPAFFVAWGEPNAGFNISSPSAGRMLASNNHLFIQSPARAIEMALRIGW